MNIARRILYFSSMMLTAIMLVGFTSCTSEEFFLKEGGKSLSLQVAATGQAQTRSLGEEDLNENLMERLDYFFFKADDSNNATGTLVYHITETNQTSQIDHEYSSGLSDELLTGLFGSTTPADRLYCYVYVVVNYDGFTNDNITVGSTTLADIQNITFSTTLSTNAAQPSFVMAGGSPVQLRIVNGTYYRLATSRPIPVTRAAAKIDLVVTEVQQYTDRDPNDGSRWESHPENMYVMFYNGVSKSYIYADAGHYITNPANTDYFSVRGSNMRQMTEILTETGGHTGRYEHSIPFYSYMSNWSNDADHMSCLILVLPWQHIDRDGNEIQDGYQSTYYQIPTSLDKRYLENHYYQIEVMIGMIGSFELPDPVILEDNTYMVVDWGTQNVSAAVRESVYLIVEKPKVTMNNENSGKDPYISSHPVSEKVTKVEYMDYSNVTIYKWTIEKGSFGTAGNGNNKRDLVYKVTRTDMSNGSSMEYCKLDENGQNYRDRRWRDEYKTFYTLFVSFSASHTNTNIVLTHGIPNDMFVPYDVTVEVTNTMISTPEKIVFTQYPPIYISGEKSNGYAWVNYYNNSYYRDHNYGGYYENTYNRRTWDDDDNLIGNFSYYQGEIDNSGEGSNNNPNNYIISISSLSDDTYVIGDPRSETVNNLTSLNGLTNYRPTKREGTINMVAPKFLVASSYGVVSQRYWFGRDEAEKRCASYQENGYPAGRWRVPTAAEIKFIMGLSADGYIPSLFYLTANDNEGYWCANGKVLGDGNGKPIDGNNNIITAVRCVYDIWYWGEEHSQYATTFHYGDND